MNTRTTEIKQEILSSDIILRDSSSFVHARKEGRLGWESDIAGRSLSSFATDAKTQEEAILKAYSLASDMLSVMNIPQKVTVRIDPSGKSATDSKQVWVSTKHFDNKTIDLGQKLDIFIGLTVHEGCHLLYTDWKTKMQSEKLVNRIANLLEDERIENIVGEEKPGLAGFLAETKKYYFGIHQDNTSTQPSDRLRRAVNAVIALVRFPSSLTDEEFEEFGELLLDVKRILTPYPTSTQETFDCARQIFNILKEMFKNEAKEQAQSKQQNDSDSQKSKSDSDNEDSDSQKDESDSDGEDSDSQKDESGSDGEDSDSQKDESDSDGEDSDSQKDESGSDSDEDSDSQKDESGSNGEDSDSQKDESDSDGEDSDSQKDESGSDNEDSDSQKGESDSDNEEELDNKISDLLNEIASELDDLLSPTENKLNDEDVSNEVMRNNILEELCLGDAERGKSKNSILYPIKELTQDEEDEYQKSLMRVGPYINAVRRFLQYNATESKYCLKGMRNGHLDTSKLAEAIQGNQNIYTKEQEIVTDKIAVCLLIDQSGSMCANVPMGQGRISDRITIARDTAILLDEAISKVPNIELFVFGHTADDEKRDDCEVFVYRDRHNKTRHALGACTTHSCNADGYAILEAAQRVRKQTDRKCLMFVISDGLPYAALYNDDISTGVAHTAESVRTVEKMGFDVVQIAISAEVEPECMFSKWVKFSDLSNLPRELGQIVKKAVLENAKRRAA